VAFLPQLLGVLLLVGLVYGLSALDARRRGVAPGVLDETDAEE